MEVGLDASIFLLSESRIFSDTESGLCLLSEIKPPGIAWQITSRGKFAHCARPGGMSAGEPHGMGQTAALVRPDYSITTHRRC